MDINNDGRTTTNAYNNKTHNDNNEHVKIRRYIYILIIFWTSRGGECGGWPQQCAGRACLLLRHNVCLGMQGIGLVMWWLGQRGEGGSQHASPTALRCLSTRRDTANDDESPTSKLLRARSPRTKEVDQPRTFETPLCFGNSRFFFPAAER